MSLQQALSFGVIAMMLMLFLWDRFRYDVVALLALLAAVACGIVPIDKAFDGFANPLLPLIAAALIVSAAVGNSGIIEVILRPLRPLMRSPNLQIAVLTAGVTVLSAVVKNIGALAIFLPIALQVARRSERSPSEFLMPLSFGSLIGGMMTLIGTSPNLIASAVRQELLGAPYRMFDFLPVGFGISVIGLIFLSFGWRLIPVRRTGHDADAPFRIEDYVSEARLPASSPLVDKTVADLEALSEGDVSVVAIIREGNRRYVPAAHWTLFTDDVLVLESDPGALGELVAAAKLVLVVGEEFKTTKSADISVIEAVITNNSTMVGKSPTRLKLRQRYGVNLLAVSRGGRRTTARLKSVIFAEGDVVVLQGDEEMMSETLTDLGCLPLAERKLQLGRSRKVLLPILVLAACVGASATEIVPPAIAFTAGAVFLAVSRILGLKEIYDSIDWPILILLGALIPVGEGIRSTGTTDIIAGWMSAVAGLLPVSGTLVMLLVVTMLATPLLHHAAAVIVMGPVAASLAQKLGFNADPFLMSVAVGASCDFLSPIGHQCNTLVMGPGGYRFKDYWHLGLPLSTLVAVFGVPLILLVWPLH